MKKLISIILCVSLAFLPISNTYAEGANQTVIDDKEAIVQALRDIESEKELFNLSDVDFEDISISNPIKTYEYTSDGFSYINDFVPLKANGNIIAWAVKVVDADINTYQISTAYTDEINSLIDNSDSFALIYDLNSCYLYNGENIYHLGDYSIQVEKRFAMPSDIELIDFSCIELNNVDYEYFLGYDSNYPVMYGPVIRAYSCDVKYVSQQGPWYKKLCWAASIACIGNYVTGRDLDAIDVAKYRYGDSNFDQTIPSSQSTAILSAIYGIAYKYSYNVPSISTIERNLKDNYPIYGTFEYFDDGEIKGHAAVIYRSLVYTDGSKEDTLGVMDPISGFYTGTYTSSGFMYCNTRAAVWFTLIQAAEKY